MACEMGEDGGGVVAVVDAGVMPSPVRDAESSEHVHHAFAPLSGRDLEGLLDVDPGVEVWRKGENVGEDFGLSREHGEKIPVAAGDEGRGEACGRSLGVSGESFLDHPSVEVGCGGGKVVLVVDHGLDDAGEVGAEGAELRMEGGSNVAMEGGLDGETASVHFEGGPLDDLLRTRLMLEVACGFKVEHEEVVEELRRCYCGSGVAHLSPAQIQPGSAGQQ